VLGSYGRPPGPRRAVPSARVAADRLPGTPARLRGGRWCYRGPPAVRASRGSRRRSTFALAGGRSESFALSEPVPVGVTFARGVAPTGVGCLVVCLSRRPAGSRPGPPTGWRRDCRSCHLRRSAGLGELHGVRGGALGRLRQADPLLDRPRGHPRGTLGQLGPEVMSARFQSILPGVTVSP